MGWGDGHVGDVEKLQGLSEESSSAERRSLASGGQRVGLLRAWSAGEAGGGNVPARDGCVRNRRWFCVGEGNRAAEVLARQGPAATMELAGQTGCERRLRGGTFRVASGVTGQQGHHECGRLTVTFPFCVKHPFLDYPRSVLVV